MRPSSAFLAIYLILFSLSAGIGQAQSEKTDSGKSKTLYGIASYYGKGFHGKKTANGEIFNENGMTAACNVLPLGTWIRVTNLKNEKSVIVKVNDRLHYRMRRLVDMSRASAAKLGYINAGLTKVRVEVLGKSIPDSLKL
jgi:rare lipoprotein A